MSEEERKPDFIDKIQAFFANLFKKPSTEELEAKLEQERIHTKIQLERAAQRKAQQQGKPKDGSKGGYGGFVDAVIGGDKSTGKKNKGKDMNSELNKMMGWK